MWIASGRKVSKIDRQSVFFTAVNPMEDNQDQEEVQHDLDKPRITVYKNTWRAQQNTVYRCNLKLVQKKIIAVLPNWITCNRSFQHTAGAFCIEKVHMKAGEDLYCRVHQSPRLPRVVLTPNLQCGRHHPPIPEARKSTDHHSEQSVQYKETCRSLLEDTRRKHLEESQRGKYRETCRGNVDYRIPDFPLSTVQREDSYRKETVKRLIQQFETHPKRDSLTENLKKTEEFNPFSEKSRELITSMGNMEDFKLCEISSKIQCPDCSLNWEVGSYAVPATNACSLQKGIDS